MGSFPLAGGLAGVTFPSDIPIRLSRLSELAGEPLSTLQAAIRADESSKISSKLSTPRTPISQHQEQSKEDEEGNFNVSQGSSYSQN